MRTPESFNYFIYRADCLSRGYVGFIVPSSYLAQYEFSKSRKYIVNKNTLKNVINLGDGVFEDVATPTCIISWKVKSASDTQGCYGDYRHVNRQALGANLFAHSNLLPIPEGAFTAGSSKGIIEKCLIHKPLKEIEAGIATGISSGLDKAFIYNREDVLSLRLEKPLLRKLVLGGELSRYLMVPESGKQIAYLTPEVDLELYSNIKKAISPYREALNKRREAANGKIPWFSLHWPRRKEVFECPKIIIRQTASSIMASFDTDGWYCLKSAIMIQLPSSAKLSYLYFLALLNSKLIDFIYQDLVGEKARVFPEVKPVQLFKLPIKEILEEEQRPFIEKAEIMLAENRALHEQSSKFLALVKSEFGLEKPSVKLEQWYTLDFAAFNAELAKKKISLSLAQKAEWMDYFEKQKDIAAQLKATIDAIDRDIDQMVYALYGLTADEIAIVEEAAQ